MAVESAVNQAERVRLARHRYRHRSSAKCRRGRVAEISSEVDMRLSSANGEAIIPAKMATSIIENKFGM
jgi:hypothetical protein